MQTQERVRHWGFASEFDRRSSPHYVLCSFKAAAEDRNLHWAWVTEAANNAIARAAPDMNPSQVTRCLQEAGDAGWMPAGIARARLREALLSCLPDMTAEQVAISLASAAKLRCSFRRNTKLFDAAEKAIVATWEDMDVQDYQLLLQFRGMTKVDREDACLMQLHVQCLALLHVSSP